MSQDNNTGNEDDEDIELDVKLTKNTIMRIMECSLFTFIVWLIVAFGTHYLLGFEDSKAGNLGLYFAAFTFWGLLIYRYSRGELN